MHIGIGGSYRLYKSGEIIPKLNGCVDEPPHVFESPQTCPVCGSRLERENETADIRCFNALCPAQLTRTIAYFASLDAMNIMGLGDTIVDNLIKGGYVKTFATYISLRTKETNLLKIK